MPRTRAWILLGAAQHHEPHIVRRASRSTPVTKVRSPLSFAMSAALSAASTTKTRSAPGAEAVTAAAAPRTLAMNAFAQSVG